MTNCLGVNWSQNGRANVHDGRRRLTDMVRGHDKLIMATATIDREWDTHADKARAFGIGVLGNTPGSLWSGLVLSRNQRLKLVTATRIRLANERLDSAKSTLRVRPPFVCKVPTAVLHDDSQMGCVATETVSSDVSSLRFVKEGAVNLPSYVRVTIDLLQVKPTAAFDSFSKDSAVFRTIE
ncbi:hypothetical protein AB1N83_013375 [Pleurotus pulmonarius]